MLNVPHCPLHCRISLHPVHQRPPALRALCDATGGKENATKNKNSLYFVPQHKNKSCNLILPKSYTDTLQRPNENTKYTDPSKPSGKHQLQIKIKGVAQFPTKHSYPFALKPKMNAVTYKNNNKKNDYKLEYNLKFQENN